MFFQSVRGTYRHLQVGVETSLRTAGLDLTEELECDLWLTSGLSCLLTTTVKCWMEDALKLTWMSEEGKPVEQEPGPDLESMKEAE